jgi:4'-phosphopantetheinyl transferase
VATERCTVDVWSIDLDPDRDRVSSMLALLGGGERVRAARLRTTEERLRFVVVRGAVRIILGRYTGLPPAALHFETTGAGKPCLADARVSFSLAHTEGLSVCAVTSSGEIGVDVERVWRIPDVRAIAERYFGPSEGRALAATPHHARAAAFFSTWTRKEAIVKAGGDALAQPLHDLDVGALPLPTIVRVSTHMGDRDWHLDSFDPAPGYVGALASACAVDRLQHLDFSDVFGV